MPQRRISFGLERTAECALRTAPPIGAAPPEEAPFGCVMRRLMELEDRLRLFEKRVDGAPLWEYARLRVHYELAAQLDLLQIETERRPLGTVGALQWGLGSLREAAAASPLRVGRRDIVFLGYPRRQLQSDRRWWDVHLDPLLEGLPWSHVYLRRRDRRRHYDPIPTRHSVPHDAIDLHVAAQRLLRPLRLSTDDRRWLAATSESLCRTFGVRLDLGPIVAPLLGRRRALVGCYRRMFARVRPKLVVVLAPNEQEQAAVEAAREAGIRTAELQHGAFSPHDPSYAFPASAGRLACFADDLLLYGDYWREVLSSPPPQVRVRTIGFRHFEGNRARHPRGASDRIVFLSQRPIGRPLSRFALDLARHPRFAGRVVFRLHPDEADWRERYPWLVDAPLDVDDGGTCSLYETLASAGAQAGVYSFALFEGAAQGLKTFVVGLPGSEAMTPLVELRGALKVRTADDLVDAERTTRLDVPIFRPGARDNFYEYLRKVVGSPDA